jgi:Glycosyl hydrolase family 59
MCQDVNDQASAPAGPGPGPSPNPGPAPGPHHARRAHRGLRRRPAFSAVAVAACVALTAGVASPPSPATHTARPAGQVPGSGPTTRITIDGQRHGPVFNGVGAISGGGGNARLLIDYPPKQQNQILNYLFGPGGADLQILKLEIGDDTAPSDGAEPSVEQAKGQIDCDSGYSWWLAEQAVARNPHVQLVGLQWGAPGWVGNVWSNADIGYVIDWLNCAKSHHLTIGYLGGWDEHGYNITYFENLRKALNSSGYSKVKLMAADSFPGKSYDWKRTFQVANAAAANPGFKAALGVIAVHDTCGGPTRGYQCESTPAARHLGLPLWESELGTLHGAMSAADMARTINNGFNQAGMTGFLEWPLMSSMPPGLLYEGRGMVVANEPQSGSYYVNRITWAVAQTTQFVQPGWRHVTGADGALGATGSYDAYVSPGGRDWSLVTENTGHHGGQPVGPQTITVHLTGGLKTARIGVWSTDLTSAKSSRWFVRQADVHVSHGTFSYVVQPGFAVTFTSTTGQSHLSYTPPAAANMHLPYIAIPDLSNEAWGLGTQEGAFVYESCGGGVGGACLEQVAGPNPIWWQKPGSGTPDPYAIVGSTTWSSYTVSASVLIPAATDSASLIGRYSNQAYGLPSAFDGYVFRLTGSGGWELLRNSQSPNPTVLGSGTAAGITPGTWHTISLSMHGDQISAAIDEKTVSSKIDSTYSSGLAGISSDWAQVQFGGLTAQ